MENQHQKITGYRELSEGDIGLMNEVKALAEKTGQLLAVLENLTETDMRWLNIGKTDLQKGFMALTRAIAKPNSF